MTVGEDPAPIKYVAAYDSFLFLLKMSINHPAAVKVNAPIANRPRFL